MKDISRRREQGFTLVESLVVVAIVSIILMVAIPALKNSLRSYQTRGAASQMALDLRFTRNASVKKKLTYTIAINNKTASTNPNTYTISASGVPTITRALEKGVDIDPNSLTQITFQSLGSCTTLPTADTLRHIDITGRSTYRYRLIASLTGNVSGQVF